MRRSSCIPFFFSIIFSLSFSSPNQSIPIAESRLDLAYYTCPCLHQSLTTLHTSTSPHHSTPKTSSLFQDIFNPDFRYLSTSLPPRCLSLKLATKLRPTLDLWPCLQSKPPSSQSPTQRHMVVSPSRHHNVAPAPTLQLSHP